MDRLSRLKEFLATNPHDAFSRHALALEYIKLGQEEQARVEFQAILRDNPDQVGTYYHLGKLLERAGEKTSALLIYQQGILQAKAAGDTHSARELLAAAEWLVDD